MTNKVFVSGCFDLLHSGHISFLKSAAKFGELYVAIGSDETIQNLKNRYPIYNQEERLFMISELSCVKKAFVSSGSGILDFKKELEEIKPEIFIVNADGDSLEKRKLCESLGVKYAVLKRIPKENLPQRSTTRLAGQFNIPYRIDLAGGWLDQPFVSKKFPGPVLTISIEPTLEFNLRSGMATSTRNKAMKLWGHHIPKGNPEELAKILFSYENPPGTKEVAGSQDSLGIVLPGLNYLDYGGEYWPNRIESIKDDKILKWIEEHICLIPLVPRKNDFKVLDRTNVTEAGTKKLSVASNFCWKSIKAKNLTNFGKAMKDSFEAQIEMFPLMSNSELQSEIDKYRESTFGWKVSGAGGGGYLIFVTDKQIESSIKINIRRGEGIL